MDVEIVGAWVVGILCDVGEEGDTPATSRPGAQALRHLAWPGGLRASGEVD